MSGKTRLRHPKSHVGSGRGQWCSPHFVFTKYQAHHCNSWGERSLGITTRIDQHTHTFIHTELYNYINYAQAFYKINTVGIAFLRVTRPTGWSWRSAQSHLYSQYEGCGRFSSYALQDKSLIFTPLEHLRRGSHAVKKNFKSKGLFQGTYMPFLTMWFTQSITFHRHWIHNAAAAAKLLQLCPTLCNPIDGSPSGSTIPGILQARTLEWVAISFSNAWK